MQPTDAANLQQIETPVIEEPADDPVAEPVAKPSPYVDGRVYLVDCNEAIVYEDEADAQKLRAYRDLRDMWNRQEYGDYPYTVEAL